MASFIIYFRKRESATGSAKRCHDGDPSEAHLRVRTRAMYTQEFHVFLVERLIRLHNGGTGILEEDRQEMQKSGAKEIKGRLHASNAGCGKGGDMASKDGGRFKVKGQS